MENIEEINIALEIIEEIKKMDNKHLELLSADLRNKILEAVKTNGGHLSSNLGIVELTIALIRQFDLLYDDVIFDVGHQTYAYKLLTNRKLDTLRQKGGIKSFQSMSESVFDKISAGHSSTSLSIAYAYATDKKLRGDDSYTVCVVGDSSFLSGMSFEALDLIAEENDLKLIIVLNDNGMSIGQPRGVIERNWSRLRNSIWYSNSSARFRNTFSKYRATRWFYRFMKHIKDNFKQLVLKDNFIEAMKFNYLGPIDGHNVKLVENALKNAKKLSSPFVIHVITKKGKGIMECENDKDGKYHGVKQDIVFDSIDEYIENKEIVETFNMSKCCGQMIHDLMKDDESIVLVNPAMVIGSNTLTSFNDYPERCFDTGIAEEHAVTFASGFALKGRKVFVSIYSTFMQRAYDQISHDVARLNLDVTFFVDHCGLVGPDGETHQGIYDVAFLNSIPNVKVYMPYDKASLYQLYKEHENDKNPKFFRISLDNISENADQNYETFNVRNSDTLLIAVGPRGKKLLESIKDYDTYLMTNLLMNKDELLEAIPNILNYKKIIMVDQYSIFEGSCLNLLGTLNQLNYKGEFVSKSIPKSFIEQATIEEQIVSCGLDNDTILDEISKK